MPLSERVQKEVMTNLTTGRELRILVKNLCENPIQLFGAADGIMSDAILEFVTAKNSRDEYIATKKSMLTLMGSSFLTMLYLLAKDEEFNAIVGRIFPDTVDSLKANLSKGMRGELPNE